MLGIVVRYGACEAVRGLDVEFAAAKHSGCWPNGAGVIGKCVAVAGLA